jgi:hypothetical protein
MPATLRLRPPPLRSLSQFRPRHAVRHNSTFERPRPKTAMFFPGMHTAGRGVGRKEEDAH